MTRFVARVPKLFSNPMARVGSITAIFSLVAGIYGGWHFLSGKLEQHRNIDRLIASASIQLDTLDYAGAWNTLEQAASVDADSARVQEFQENVAMRWLEDVHLTGKETFSEISDKLDPVLARGIAAAKSPRRQADLLAHLGWSYYLRSRDADTGADSEALYRRALAKDPGNAYAEAMLGYRILSNGGALAEADKHFNIALTREDVRPFVRKLQIERLARLAVHDDSVPAAVEIVRIANVIREEGGNVTTSMQRSIASVYSEFLEPNYGAGSDDAAAVVLNALLPADNLATFDWLMGQPASAEFAYWDRAYIRSELLERAGRRSEALVAYRALQKHFASSSYTCSRYLTDCGGRIPTETSKAISRLTRSAVGSR